MYIKITSGVPENYSIAQLRKDNPQVSFPITPSKECLAEWGVYPLKQTDMPDEDHTKVVSLSNPIQVDNEWVQSWSVRETTEEELAERTFEKANEIRSQRNSLLDSTDWTQMSDAPVVKTLWAAYRVELRNFTTQQGFPWNVNWPTPPT